MSSVLILTSVAVGTVYAATMAFVAFQLRRAPLLKDLDESEAEAAVAKVEVEAADNESFRARAPRVVWKHSRRSRIVRQFSTADALVKQAESGGMSHAA